MDQLIILLKGGTQFAIERFPGQNVIYVRKTTASGIQTYFNVIYDNARNALKRIRRIRKAINGRQ